MAEPETVLTLSTTDFERPTVVIDGERYEMRSPDELTQAMLRDIFGIGQKLTALDKIEDPDEQIETLDRELRHGMAICMVGLPDEVYARLSLMQQRRIIQVFTGLWSDAKDESQASPSPA